MTFTFPAPPTEFSPQHLLSFIRHKCDKNGQDLPPGVPPEPLTETSNPWLPSADEVSFRLADPLFSKAEMLGALIKELLDIWALDIRTRFKDDSGVPFGNQLPTRSGSYAFGHATKIHKEGQTVEGAMYCGIMLGADKTTVSVATVHVEYHPLYITVGNLHNSARRGLRGGVALIGFLASTKAGRKYDDDNDFRVFKKRLYHSSIAAILQSLKPAMKTLVVRLCPDGYHRRIIYDLAAFIADYPEQVFLAGIAQEGCPWCTASSTNLDDPESQLRTREWT
ncbi:hypothetical protein PM082_022973 [Marasmius tenuissimus]|nr:hypothetical protein PM082_022973 [Marasmius tenuissimus]